MALQADGENQANYNSGIFFVKMAWTITVGTVHTPESCWWRYGPQQGTIGVLCQGGPLILSGILFGGKIYTTFEQLILVCTLMMRTIILLRLITTETNGLSQRGASQAFSPRQNSILKIFVMFYFILHANVLHDDFEITS